MWQTLAPGNLLVATQKLHDADLSKSVVLLIYSNPKAAIGLIVNRPVEKEKKWSGGPIPLGSNALVKTSTAPENSQRILADVYMVPAKDSVKLTGEFRIYTGTCGWTMVQLREEVARGDWRVIAGKSEIVFDPHPETVWERLAKGR